MDESLKDQLEGLFSDLQGSTQPEKHLAAQVASARESAERYRQLVENLPVGVYRVMPGPQGKFLVANPAFRNLFGIDSEEALGRTTLADLIVNPAEHFAFFDRLMADGNVASCTLPFKKLDGTLILGLVTAKAAYASEGEATYFDCVIEDTLDHQHITRAASSPAGIESDSWKLRYDVAAVASGQVVYDYDTATGSILWSDSLEQVLGYDLAQMKGGIAQWADLIHPEDRWALIGELDLAEGKCAPYEVEYRFRHKNGDYLWMRDRGVFVPNSAGQAAHRIGTLQGIAAPRQTEESGHWMRLVFNSMREAVMVTTLDGVLVSVNSAAEKMFGYTQEEFEYLSPESLYVDQEHYLEMHRLVKEFFDQSDEAHLRLEARRKNGDVFPSAHTISLIKNDEGQPIAILTVIRDITAERERSEERERRIGQAHVTAQPARASAAAPAFEELYHFNKFCETNYYARGALASALDQLYRRLVSFLKERFGYYHVQLFRYGPMQDALLLVEGYGQVGAQMKAEGHRWPVGRGIVGAAATGQPVLASDVTSVPAWVPTPRLPNTRGELAVPIKLRDELLGVLDVHSDQVGALTQEDQMVLTDLAGQIAIAIENARRLEKA